MGTPRDFSLAELESATGNWSKSRILGEGGFASVYKGKLRVVGEVAIKRCCMPDDETERVFAEKAMRAELETISGYHHENICALIGSFVDRVNQQAPYVLVYELCENGCLLDRIACRDHLKNPVLPLSEEQRVLIALGSCRALEYLHVKGKKGMRPVFMHRNFRMPHFAAMPPIVHRDVKSPNILLAFDMVPKLADFGTIRQDKLEGNSTHIKTETVIGTRCYMVSTI
jgi:serine/threonine protein kinase